MPEGTDAEQTPDVMEEKERERSCELVLCLEIMCIFSRESIEKSLPHNLQEPNSRGEDNAEDGEREVLCIDLVLVNWFDI